MTLMILQKREQRAKNVHLIDKGRVNREYSAGEIEAKKALAKDLEINEKNYKEAVNKLNKKRVIGGTMAALGTGLYLNHRAKKE